MKYKYYIGQRAFVWRHFDNGIVYTYEWYHEEHNKWKQMPMSPAQLEDLEPITDELAKQILFLQGV